jgi:hypothetical protein
MAEKLPGVIDYRGDDTVLDALPRLLPNFQTVTIGTGGPLGSNLLHALKIQLESGGPFFVSEDRDRLLVGSGL